MAQHTLTLETRSLCPTPTLSRVQVARAALMPFVALLITLESLRDALSLLQPHAALRRYRVGRMAMGIHSHVYLVLWTGHAVYVRPAGCYGVLAKTRAGHARSMFEAMQVAQQVMGTQTPA